MAEGKRCSSSTPRLITFGEIPADLRGVRAARNWADEIRDNANFLREALRTHAGLDMPLAGLYLLADDADKWTDATDVLDSVRITANEWKRVVRRGGHASLGFGCGECGAVCSR